MEVAQAPGRSQGGGSQTGSQSRKDSAALGLRKRFPGTGNCRWYVFNPFKTVLACLTELAMLAPLGHSATATLDAPECQLPAATRG